MSHHHRVLLSLITIFLFIRRFNLSMVSRVRRLPLDLLIRRSMKKLRSLRIKMMVNNKKRKVARKVIPISSSK